MKKEKEEIIKNHTDLFWYSPNDCLPRPENSVLTIQKRANGDLIYSITFYNDEIGWFTEEQGFSKQPIVIAWTFLPAIQRFIKSAQAKVSKT